MRGVLLLGAQSGENLAGALAGCRSLLTQLVGAAGLAVAAAAVAQVVEIAIDVVTE